MNKMRAIIALFLSIQTMPAWAALTFHEDKRWEDVSWKTRFEQLKKIYDLYLLSWKKPGDFKEFLPKIEGSRQFCQEVFWHILDEHQQYHGAETDQTVYFLKIALENGADLNGSNGTETPLIFAIRHGWIRVVEFLLDSGAAVDVHDQTGRTPFDWAMADVLPMNVAMARLLVLHGSQVHITDAMLIRAAQRGSKDMVEFLLDNGADVNACDEIGSTPLVKVCACPGIDCSLRNEIIRLLLARGAHDCCAPSLEYIVQKSIKEALDPFC